MEISAFGDARRYRCERSASSAHVQSVKFTVGAQDRAFRRSFCAVRLDHSQQTWAPAMN